VVIKLEKKEITDLINSVRSTNAIPEDDIDEMAIPTYLHNNKLIQWLFWERLNLIAKVGYKKQINEVLDFGCGIGTLLPTLYSNTKVKVHATDLFPQFAQELSKRNKMNIMFHPSDGLHDSIENESLDLIVAADSMEHLEDPGLYLKIFRNKLKKNGRLVISGPTENWIYKLGRILAGYVGKGDYHHTNIDKLEKVITSYGFKIISRKYLPFKFAPHLFKVLEFVVQ
jgi:2-polyprenyl-3-methyl-5-hydroxy-6-metoxy-1,4-benzoquinol methylase